MSPFAGMDPYLEDYWTDFHARFLPEIADAIADQLPAAYEARIGERLQIVEGGEPGRVVYPDVAVERMRAATVHGGGGDRIATLEPVLVPQAAFDEVRELTLHIVRRATRELVTVIEVLSPANKTGRGRDQYLAKREEVLADAVHLVEIDLLLVGERIPLSQPLPPGDYFALVTRAERRGQCEVYAWAGDRELPAIPVPLVRPDPDIPLDLAAVFRATYTRGRYSASIDYTQPPPGVPEPNRAWIARRRRSTP